MSKQKPKSNPNPNPSPKHAAPVSDPRFQRLHTDPRFLRPQREAGKVVLDDRFKSLLTDGEDAEGKKKKKLDKFGRKVRQQDTEKERMKRFYRIQDGQKAQAEQEDDEGADQDDDEDDRENTKDQTGFIDYARGGGVLESSGDEDDSSEEEDSDDSEESSSDDSDDQEEITVGRSSVRNREERRLREEQEEEEEEEESDLEVDLDEDEDEDEEEKQHDRAEKDSLNAAKSELSLDSKTTALLDAQAESAIKASREEEEQEQDEEGPSTSSRKPMKKSKRNRSAKEVPVGDDTHRLAVVNMDWDHLRALDLYKVFSSLVSPTAPPASSIQRSKSNSDSNPKSNKQTTQVQGELFHVRVYPSDFGRERMAKEDREGPPKDIFEGGKNGSKKKKKKNRRNDSDLSEDEDDEPLVQVDDGEEFDVEKLRKYQLERLRYFYAIATFSSKEAARFVYDEIDGTEMERTANTFDLRFVPDGMEFPEGPGENFSGGDQKAVEGGWRDECRGEEISGGKGSKGYKPIDWRTDALRHSKVSLTWDADDPERAALTRRRHVLETSKTKKGKKGPTAAELREDDFRAYLGSGSESEGEEDPEAIERMRKLMNLDGEGNGETSSGGVFGRRRDNGLGGGGEEEGDMQVTFMPGLSEAANRKAKGEKKKSGDEEETTIEKYKRKQREKKEKRKKKLDQEDHDRDERDGDGDGVEDGDESIGWDDPFFQEADDVDLEAALAAEEEGGETDPKFKTSKKEKKSKKGDKNLSPEEEAELKRSKAELQLMVDDDSADEFGGIRSHFDLKDVIRAEKGLDKKSKKKKKYRKNKEDDDDEKGPGSIQPGFEIDVNDDRFSGLMEDHRFALDPSHPSFIKTKGMEKLIQERRNKLKSKLGDEEIPREEGTSIENNVEKVGKEENWKEIVGRMKKRDRETDGPRGKMSNGKEQSKKRKV